MNDYKLYIDGTDVTNYTGELEWSDDLDTISTQISFKLANVNANIGSTFQLFNNSTEILRGIIVDEDYTSNSNIKSYVGFDYGFYLNKNETIIQFNEISATQAIQQLLNSFKTPYGMIANIPMSIRKIYKDRTVSDIIKDILSQATKQTGVKYLFECPLGVVNIYDIKTLTINPTYQLSEISSVLASEESINNFKATNSMIDLKNKIIITDNKEKSTRIRAEFKNQDMINKYGLLQQVETFEGTNAEQNQMATTMLNDLCRIKKARTLDIIGDDSVRAGRIITFNQPKLDLIGRYLIKSSEHVITSQHHKISLEVESFYD